MANTIPAVTTSLEALEKMKNNLDELKVLASLNVLEKIAEEDLDLYYHCDSKELKDVLSELNDISDHIFKQMDKNTSALAVEIATIRRRCKGKTGAFIAVVNFANHLIDYLDSKKSSVDGAKKLCTAYFNKIVSAIEKALQHAIYEKKFGGTTVNMEKLRATNPWNNDSRDQ